MPQGQSKLLEAGARIRRLSVKRLPTSLETCVPFKNQHNNGKYQHYCDNTP